jgi:PAS domain-containing protein
MDNIKKTHSKPSYEQLEEIQKELIFDKKKIIEVEKRFESLYKNAPLPYHSLNQDGCLIEVNPAWLSTMGYSPL